MKLPGFLVKGLERNTAQSQRPSEEFIALLPAVRRFFVRRASTGEADDLTQEVFARLAKLPVELEIEHASSYVFQVAAHVLADKRRKDYRQHASKYVELEEILHPVEVSSPESILVHRDMLRTIDALMDELPPRARDAFLLHRFEEMTYQAISKHLGCSISSVEKYIARATKHIAMRMRELDSEL